MPFSAYAQFLQTRRDADRFRALRAMAPGIQGHTRMGGQQLLNFSSNNYMNLAHHPALMQRAQEWTMRWGTGATASRLVSGNLEPFEQVEARLAAGKRHEAALVFNSGFQANSAMLTSLLDATILKHPPLVFSDRLNHASMHQGCRTAGVRQIRYHHNEMNHLEELLKHHRHRPGPRFILSETVFSMDGDQADVEGLIALKERYGAFLYLDEAHAVGVLGPDGFGLAAAFPGQVDLVMGTFSKALGGFGAYAVCSHAVRHFLINHCAGFIYSTALPPGVLGAMDAALEILPSLTTQRQQLLAHAEMVRHAFRRQNLDVGDSTTQIIPVMVGAESLALSLSRELELQEKILAVAVRPPTVPEGSSRLRFSLTAAHGPEEIARLTQAVAAWKP